MARGKNRPRERPLEEIIRRQRVDWEELFYDIFGNWHNYAWNLHILDQNPSRKLDLTHYAMIRDDSLFQCEPCSSKQWGSAWGWVSIWYSLNRNGCIGDVYLRIFGQRCKHCASATEGKGQLYAEAIWDQNEIEDTWKTFRSEMEATIDRPIAPRREILLPFFSPMPKNWNDLFGEMFADLMEQHPSHSWDLVLVDRDVRGFRSVKGPYRMETESGNLFVWFGMGIKRDPPSSGKVFIRVLKKGNAVRDLAAWTTETIEMVLFATYQKIGHTYYNRLIDLTFPQLEVVLSPWARNMAKHQQQFCQACDEGLCQKLSSKNQMQIIRRNPMSRGPRNE